MKLIPQGWVTPVPSPRPILDKATVKADIRALVTKPMEYEDIIDTIQKDFLARVRHIDDAEISECIREVDLEWHPVVEEL